MAEEVFVHDAQNGAFVPVLFSFNQQSRQISITNPANAQCFTFPLPTDLHTAYFGDYRELRLRGLSIYLKSAEYLYKYLYFTLSTYQLNKIVYKIFAELMGREDINALFIFHTKSCAVCYMYLEQNVFIAEEDLHSDYIYLQVTRVGEYCFASTFAPGMSSFVARRYLLACNLLVDSIQGKVEKTLRYFYGYANIVDGVKSVTVDLSLSLDNLIYYLRQLDWRSVVMDPNKLFLAYGHRVAVESNPIEPAPSPYFVFYTVFKGKVRYFNTDEIICCPKFWLNGTPRHVQAAIKHNYINNFIIGTLDGKELLVVQYKRDETHVTGGLVETTVQALTKDGRIANYAAILHLMYFYTHSQVVTRFEECQLRVISQALSATPNTDYYYTKRELLREYSAEEGEEEIDELEELDYRFNLSNLVGQEQCRFALFRGGVATAQISYRLSYRELCASDVLFLVVSGYNGAASSKRVYSWEGNNVTGPRHQFLRYQQARHRLGAHFMQRQGRETADFLCFFEDFLSTRAVKKCCVSPTATGAVECEMVDFVRNDDTMIVVSTSAKYFQLMRSVKLVEELFCMSSGTACKVALGRSYLLIYDECSYCIESKMLSPSLDYRRRLIHIDIFQFMRYTSVLVLLLDYSKFKEINRIGLYAEEHSDSYVFVVIHAPGQLILKQLPRICMDAGSPYNTELLYLERKGDTTCLLTSVGDERYRAVDALKYFFTIDTVVDFPDIGAEVYYYYSTQLAINYNIYPVNTPGRRLHSGNIYMFNLCDGKVFTIGDDEAYLRLGYLVSQYDSCYPTEKLQFYNLVCDNAVVTAYDRDSLFGNYVFCKKMELIGLAPDRVTVINVCTLSPSDVVYLNMVFPRQYANIVRKTQKVVCNVSAFLYGCAHYYYRKYVEYMFDDLYTNKDCVFEYYERLRSQYLDEYCYGTGDHGLSRYYYLKHRQQEP